MFFHSCFKETLSKVNSSNLPWSDIADDVDNDDEEEEWKVKQHNYIVLILLVLLPDKNHGNPHSE